MFRGQRLEGEAEAHDEITQFEIAAERREPADFARVRLELPSLALNPRLRNVALRQMSDLR